MTGRDAVVVAKNDGGILWNNKFAGWIENHRSGFFVSSYTHYTARRDRELMQMLRDVGFQQVQKMSTDGQPGIFATLDAGAPKSLGLYFMYDVKQADPVEWSSPPFEAALVEKPGSARWWWAAAR